MAIVDVIEHQTAIRRDNLYRWFRETQHFVISDNDYEDPYRVACAAYADQVDWNADPPIDPLRVAGVLQWGKFKPAGKSDPPHTPWADQTVWLQDIDCRLFDFNESRQKWLVVGKWIDWRSAHKQGQQLENVQKPRTGQTPNDQTETGQSAQTEEEKMMDKDDRILLSSNKTAIKPPIKKKSSVTMVRRVYIAFADFSHAQRNDFMNAVNSQIWGSYPAETVRLIRWDYKGEYVVLTDDDAGTNRRQEKWYNCELEFEYDPDGWKTRYPDVGTSEYAGGTGPPEDIYSVVVLPDEKSRTLSTGGEYPMDSSGKLLTNPDGSHSINEKQQYKLRDFNLIPDLIPL